MAHSVWKEHFVSRLAKQNESSKAGYVMKLKPKTLIKLKEILLRDHGIVVDENELNDFGVSLLKITRLAVTALARADDNSSIQARERTSLESNTSM